MKQDCKTNTVLFLGLIVALFVGCQNPARESVIKNPPAAPIINSAYLAATNYGKNAGIFIVLNDSNNINSFENTITLFRSEEQSLFQPVLQQIPGNGQITVQDPSVEFPLGKEDFVSLKYMAKVVDKNDSISLESNIYQIRLLKPGRIDSVIVTDNNGAKEVSFVIFKDLSDAEFILSVRDTLDSLIWQSEEVSDFKTSLTFYGPKLPVSDNYYVSLLVFRDTFQALTVERFSVK